LLLLSEHLSQEVLLRLPHKQFVFTVSKLIRPYFKHDRKLFADISKLIHNLITDYYREVNGKELTTGSIISHQTYGDTCAEHGRSMIRFNLHWHCIILEGGIDDKNDFYHIRLKDKAKLTEVFRRVVIKLFVDKELMNNDFAVQFSNWTNSGFSVDNSVFLFPNDDIEPNFVGIKNWIVLVFSIYF
jgi:hypothetical protein